VHLFIIYVLCFPLLKCICPYFREVQCMLTAEVIGKIIIKYVDLGSNGN